MEKNHSTNLMTTKGHWYQNLGLILLAFAIAFSPRFGVGTISGGKALEIRVEDILILLLGLIWIAQLLLLRIRKVEKPPLLFPILAWIGFGFISLLTNSILGNIEVSRSLFFFLKEIEFFLFYFYVFYHIQGLDSAKFMVNVWVLLGALNAAWIIFEIVTGVKVSYYYGPTLLAEPENPFGSGTFFLTIFMFLFNVFLYYYAKVAMSPLKKGLLGVGITMPTVGIFASGSTTAFIAFGFSLLLTFLFYIMKAGAKRLPLLIVLFVFILAIFITFIGSEAYTVKRQTSLNKFLWEFGVIPSPSQTPVGASRVDIWKFYVLKAFEYPPAPFIGFGKSFVGEAHNQYIRNFVETGLIGSILFLFLILTILKSALRSFLLAKDPFIVGVSSALLVTTLTMLLISIPAESFIYGAKISEIYWFFTGIAFALLFSKKYETISAHQQRRDKNLL